MADQTVAADNFNRANSATLGTMSDGVNAWIEDESGGGVLQILSNQLDMSAGGTAAQTAFAVVAGRSDSDYYVQLDVVSMSWCSAYKTQQFFIYARGDFGFAHYYSAGVSREATGGVNPNVYLQFQITRSGTVLASKTTAKSAPSTWKFDLNGSSLSFYDGADLELSATDATYASGGTRLGEYADGWQGADNVLDNFALVDHLAGHVPYFGVLRRRTA